MTLNKVGRFVVISLFAMALSVAGPLAPPRSGAVAAGGRHSLWLKPDGTVWAWGANYYAQLGDGSFTRRTAPVQVVGLNSVAAIAAAGDWSMALRTDGTVWSWGTGRYAGFPSEFGVSVPRRLAGLAGVVSIAAGDYGGVALKGDGSVWWWGGNGFGPTTPGQLVGASDIVAAACGQGHGVLLRRDGTVWTWGSNGLGQLGDGTLTDRPQLIQVPGLTGVVSVGAGDTHSVALKSDGSVWSWGAGFSGQIGDGNSVHHQLTPARAPSLAGIKRIVAGGYGTFAQSAAGRVWEWGRLPYGEFGSSVGLKPTPVELGLLSGTVGLARGYGHGLALRADGTPMTWGNNAHGQLGWGTAIIRLWPEASSLLSNVSSAAAGRMHSLVVKKDGTLWEWGNKYYSYGFSMGAPTSTPSIVSGLSNVIAAAEGVEHSYALRSDGTVWSWGLDSHGVGVLGDGTTQSRYSPQWIPGLTGIKAIWSGLYLGAALSQAGEVWTWGLNSSGQLGDGSTTNRLAPVRVPGLSGITALALGGGSVLALRNDGTVWAWGANGGWQLGDGTRTDRTAPIMVPGLSGITAIAANYGAGLALKSDGTVWGWGVGWGSDDSPTPVQLSELAGIRAIWAGHDTRFAQTADGALWARGSNHHGNVGAADGSDAILRFVRTANVPADILSLSNSEGHTLAVTSSGELWSWGYVPSAQMTDVEASILPPQLVMNSGSYSLGASELTITSAGGSQSVALTTTTPSLPWAAVPDSGWLTATPSTGSGNASFSLRWLPNTLPESRRATIRVGGQTVNVSQAGTGTSYSISGHVRLNGTGIPGVAVLLSVATVANVSSAAPTITKFTDASGRYEFNTLPAGAIFAVTPLAANLSIAPGWSTGGPLTSNTAIDFTATRNATGFSVNRSTLSFSSSLNGAIVTPPQELTVTLTGSDTLVWNASSSKPWLAVTPLAGSSTGKVVASLVPGALPLTGSDTAIITITAPNLPNGSATVSCSLTVATTTAPPFGSFDTPLDGAKGVVGSIAVTGWALDDIGVKNVTIWRDPVGPEAIHSNGYVYIGDALFVAGARPDVEAKYPGSPMANRAGWGYLMLTYGLPAKGNGTYRIHAIATDEEGKQVKVGTKTIAVDNAHAANPFGAIDSPAPGETISGGGYNNNGWALTPQPAAIATDGSTIWVHIDGVNVDHPMFGIGRGDIATVLPGYANSNRSGGQYLLNSTRYSNGMHAIAWIVSDNQGHTDGIGSRYFNILNDGTAASADSRLAMERAIQLRTARLRRPAAPAAAYPAFRRGYEWEAALEPIRRGGEGLLEPIELKELERVEIHFAAGIQEAGVRFGDELRGLPVGSTLDAEDGIFYWQLGAGFLGEYLLEFRDADGTVVVIPIRVGGVAAAG